MSRLRIVFLVISILVSIFLLGLIMIDYISYFFISFLTILIIVLVNVTLKKRENERLSRLTMLYVDECDPESYLIELDKFHNQFIFTQKAKLIKDISRTLILIDMGKFSEAHDILEKIVDIESTLPDNVRFWYYKAWIYYFDEIDEIKKMEILIEKLKDIVQRTEITTRNQMAANYNIIKARYYVKTGIFLEAAETVYSEIFRGRYPRLTIVTSVFYLGVIAFKQDKFMIAKDKLEAVIKNAPKLNISKKAQNYLEIINQKLQEEAVLKENPIENR